MLLEPVVKYVNSLCSPEALQQVVPQMWVIVMKACLTGGGFLITSGMTRRRKAEDLTVREGGWCNSLSVFRRHGDIELCIISVAMEIYAVSPDDVAKRRHLQIENDRP